MSHLIIVMLMLLLLFFGCEDRLAYFNGPQPPSAAVFAPEESFAAHNFEGTTIDGQIVNLDNRPSGWVVLNFWATWCVPCLEEMPALQTVSESYSDLTVLGLNISDTPAAIVAFAEENAITFPLLYNITDQTVFDYNVVALPQTVIIAPNGEIVWRQFGPIKIEVFNADLQILFASYND